MESGSKGGERVSFSAWTSSNSSLDSATGNLHITAPRTKWKRRKERMNLKWLSWAASVRKKECISYIFISDWRVLNSLLSILRKETWEILLYTNFPRVIHSLKIKQIWLPSNKKTLNALLSLLFWKAVQGNVINVFHKVRRGRPMRFGQRQREKECCTFQSSQVQ